MVINKQVIVCADDYGLNPVVSQGIRQLVEMNRMSAVSCMVNAPNFAEEAKALLLINSPIKIGLHFNLSDNLIALLLKCHLRLLSKKRIKIELNNQLDLFTEHFNHPPDFIDGHHHIHQFPVIRECLLEVYQQRLSSSDIYIRCTYPIITLPQYRLKSWILSITGGRAFHKRLKQLGIPHNSTFAGVYNFSSETNYQQLFQHWLSKASNLTLIMCHPSASNSPDDSIALCRQKELDYFMSKMYLNELNGLSAHQHQSKLNCSSII